MTKKDIPWSDYVQRVVIQTANYLNFDGSYSAGGRQRHIRDLASVVRDDWKRDVLIVQKGVYDFHKICDSSFQVIGIKSDCSAYGDPLFAYKVRKLIKKTDGLVYASGEDAWPFFLNNAKAIQHGIWWDGPQSLLTRYIQKKRAMACMNTIQSMLCVDTNYINWLRCQGEQGLRLCNKCVYVPNYTDLSAIKISAVHKELPIRLICARRYEEKRGTDIFIDALGILKKKGFPFKAHISTVDGLNEISQRLLQNNVIAEVTVSQDSMDEVLTRYANADVAVVPTIWSEGTSLACVEAICSGVPVVATPVGGLGNLIIPGFNGFLVNPNPHTIAHSIQQFSDLNLLTQMRSNCLTMRDALSMKEWRCRILSWLQD